MTNKLGDAAIEQRYRDKMVAVAAALDHTFNGDAATPKQRGVKDERKVGFVLLVFEYGETEGRCNFISNGADRKDIVTMFKELIRRFEGQPEMKGTA